MPTAKGNGKYIETPEKMWELFEAYKKHVAENPRTKIEYVGRDGDRVETELATPLTMEGFECYCMDHTRITYPDLTNYFEGKPNYESYLPVCSRIRREIRADQIAGGMVGQYNASITQRLNNLKEQQEIKTDQNIQLLNNDPLSDEQHSNT